MLRATASGRGETERRVGIVNVSGTAGRVSRPGWGAYSASKSALAGWSDALYAEERSYGVHVRLVLPGFVSTGRRLYDQDRPPGLIGLLGR